MIINLKLESTDLYFSLLVVVC